jgi:hypothetical protein
MRRSEKNLCSAEHVEEIFEWAGVSGGRGGEQASYSQDADQRDSHGKIPRAQIARIARVPLVVTERYHFCGITTQYIKIGGR